MTMHFTTTILPGHRIEIQAPELPEGKQARVLVVLEEEEIPKVPILDRLAGYPGKQLFKTAEEVDEYIRQERDSWDR